MPSLPLPTILTITALQDAGVEPVLYGSQGVSLYLGAFKQFGDIDLLVENRWVDTDWQKLVTIMKGLGFTLHSDHEHDFTDKSDTQAGFASIDILVRDGITQSLEGALEVFSINGAQIPALRPELFKKAYEFSERDGYRKDVRGKKDREVVARLNEYLDQGSRPAD
jgi:hypothetical protein